MSTDFDLFTLASTDIQDVAFSPDQSLIYATTAAGDIEVFDVATRSLIATWHIGQGLGAISVSVDGSFLLATVPQTSGTSKVYRVDTTTGAFVSARESGTAFDDVQIVDAHTALLAGGQLAVQILNLDTMKFSSLSGGVYSSNNSVLAHDGHYTLFAETGISNGPLFLYDDRTHAIVASGDDYQHGSGYNWGNQAVSEAAGQVAQFIYYGSLYIYDLSLHFQQVVNIGERTDGIVYDASGQYAFVYLIDSGVVAKYATSTWTEVASYAVGTEAWDNYIGYSDQLLIDKSDMHLTVLQANGHLQLIDLSVGNGTYYGTAGADKFYGGAGDDTYYVNNTGDTVIENANEGHDLVRSSVSFTLGANVEQLILTGTADISGKGDELDNNITGNSGVNVLLGMDGADKLYAADGADQLYGGTGDDLLSGQGGDDQLNGGAGNDDMFGGAGSDVMTGGTGADVFRFVAVSDFGGADRIADFNHAQHDLIDLSKIDAVPGGADNKFAFLGAGAFTGHAGELHYVETGGNTYVSGDLNGDGVADFTLQLDGLHALVAADFVL